jgi:tRNA 2-thiouridine synthesizing protein A
VDARGLTCVRVLLLIRARIGSLASGSLMVVATDDPAAPLDLPAWCHLAGHHYVGPVACHLGRAYGIRLRADAKAVDAQRPWATQP